MIVPIMHFRRIGPDMCLALRIDFHMHKIIRLIGARIIIPDGMIHKLCRGISHCLFPFVSRRSTAWLTCVAPTTKTGAGWKGLSRLLWGHTPKFIPWYGLPYKKLIFFIIEPPSLAHAGKFNMIFPFILRVLWPPGLMWVPRLRDHGCQTIGQKYPLPDLNFLFCHHAYPFNARRVPAGPHFCSFFSR